MKRRLLFLVLALGMLVACGQGSPAQVTKTPNANEQIANAVQATLTALAPTVTPTPNYYEYNDTPMPVYFDNSAPGCENGPTLGEKTGWWGTTNIINTYHLDGSFSDQFISGSLYYYFGRSTDGSYYFLTADMNGPAFAVKSNEVSCVQPSENYYLVTSTDPWCPYTGGYATANHRYVWWDRAREFMTALTFKNWTDGDYRIPDGWEVDTITLIPNYTPGFLLANGPTEGLWIKFDDGITRYVTYGRCYWPWFKQLGMPLTPTPTP